MNERQKIVEKIRALMGKTVANGCTEQEAMAALNKARAMMDAYEVTDADIAEVKSEGATVGTHAERDPHKAKNYMAVAVATFCGCEAWRDRNRHLNFCGLPSDVELATFLIETLGLFVLSQLTDYMLAKGYSRGFLDRSRRRLIIASFVGGCTHRISERLMDLAKPAPTTSGGRALIVLKNQLIKDKMDALDLNLKKGRARSYSIDGAAHQAGRAAGDRASFARPVGAGGPLRLGAA